MIHPACKIALVRYVDDFMILNETKEQAQSIYERLQPYLKDRGLELNPEKTKVTHTEESSYVFWKIPAVPDRNGYRIHCGSSGFRHDAAVDVKHLSCYVGGIV
jgi:hypothetical protein